MRKRDLAIGIGIALIIAVFFSPLASSLPDGLEWAAEKVGIVESDVEGYSSPLPDYTVPMLGDSAVSTAGAGMIGTLLVAALMIGVGLVLRRKGKSDASR